MPIERGAEWGQAGELPDGSPIARSDAELAALVGRHDVAGLTAGDLARTLGVRDNQGESGAPRATTQLLPIDAIQVRLDGSIEHVGIAHVVVGSLALHRTSVAVMNAAFVGRKNVAPRAHPGDGRLDVVTFGLGVTDRVKAWRRMPTGTHVPHPGIAVRRVPHDEIDFGARRRIVVDGQSVGRARRLGIMVIPAAITVAV